MIHHPGNIIPEGKFKELVKKVYHKYIFPYQFKEIKHPKNVYEYQFKNGISVKFYGSQFIDMASPLRGYLKQYKPQKGDVILDLGSYNAMFSIYTSKIVGKAGKIFAFEPNPVNFKTLKKNIALNKCKNIIPINGGLWNKKDVLPMSNDDSLSSIVYNDKASFNVPVDTLDNFVKQKGLKKVSFIKMDVEGAELEIIDGGRETLTSMSPRLAIASYHERNGEKTYLEVERKLRKLGYKTSTGFPNHLTTYARKK